MLASEVALSVGATIIHCDDFFNIKISDADWDTYSIEERCRLCIDWVRVRKEAILPLLSGKKATYVPYYCLSMNDPSSKAVVKEPPQIIILDGIYDGIL